MTITLGRTVHLDEPFDDAMVRTREALKAEGFGVLTEIDIQAAFREKLDRDFTRYVILGACNPSLAYRALSATPEVGLLLPCNVTIESEPGGGTRVRLVDPLSLLGTGELAALPELAAVAAEAHERLQRVTRALASPTENH
jgi:uncharacterized protein (DUF302 family)